MVQKFVKIVRVTSWTRVIVINRALSLVLLTGKHECTILYIRYKRKWNVLNYIGR